MSLADLPTPCALVEAPTVRRNCAAMAARARELGVRLRPHVKTHKCVEVARLQVEGCGGGVTVSTMAEARGLAAAGFDDLTLAVPVAPARLAEVAELLERGVRLRVLLDSPATLAEIERLGGARGCRFGVMLKVDCGHHRAGVDPAAEASVALAAAVTGSAHVGLEGILTHAGHAYACRDRGEALAVARQERDVLVAFAARLAAAGVAVAEVSVGSTPTAVAVDHLVGVTEIRPGNYAFFDAFQVAIGSCVPADCAFTVLATVVGSYPERGAVVVDAGALALSKDPGPTHVSPGCGFGTVLPPPGLPCDVRLRVVSLSQEHGLLEVRPAAAAAALPPGTRLRIVPNHSCLAAACFDRYHVVEAGRVIDEWRPLRGW